MLGLGVWVLFAHTRQLLAERNTLPPQRRSTVAINLFAKYEVDAKKENEGVELDIDGAIFVCRRAGGNNRRYRAAIGLISAMPKYQDKINSKDQVEVVTADEEVTMEAFADSVVIDWREVLDRNNEPMLYTKENFMMLMHACPDVWRQLRLAALQIDSYRLERATSTGEELGKS